MNSKCLEDIFSPDDIKNVDVHKLSELAEEIREFLINNIARTGGHLASNLGVVEMMLAIHKVFDTERDRLVLDVGHQSYVHKILTGRREGFKNLRKFGGMSGFLRPQESKHDACVSGHASNSVSVALGMARARTLQNQDYDVIAVIGDGALTGGLAYEALNDAGQSGEPMIVVLNDNKMSIAKNVGAMSSYLSKLRLKPHYLHFKDHYRRIIKRLPGGIAFDKGVHSIKNSFKNIFLPSSLFENMGFTYLGPADGHDLKYMIYLFELARDLKRPVLIHLTTTKGKGYKFSEENPQDYHGVSKFDIESGEPLTHGCKTFSSVFGDTMCSLARSDNRICAITAAMPSGVGLDYFALTYRSRFFDVGIAEGHAVSMAAGLAAQGMIPVCAIYSTFLQRAYDMIIHDVAISGLHVVFAIDRAGLVGEDGETHHGVFDVAYLRSIPKIQILCPANFKELAFMISHATLRMSGPVAVRYNRGAEGKYQDNNFSTFQNTVTLKSGHDITLVGYGVMINNLLEAAALAKNQGVLCSVIKLNSIDPIDMQPILDSISQTKRLLICEDIVKTGGVGECISALISQAQFKCEVLLLNTGDRFIPNGETDKLLHFCGIDADGIYQKIMEACKH